MPPTANHLWAGALSQLLILEETGCPHSARHAICLLERLSESDGLDDDVRQLFERASQRLERRLETEQQRIACSCG
ncbi:MAG: hypothetical protein LBL48_05025 [Azoarcus sp.]|jgi:hypothetical protein|nr:hypothetical protein [Azoarcus sp.]